MPAVTTQKLRNSERAALFVPTPALLDRHLRCTSTLITQYRCTQRSLRSLLPGRMNQIFCCDRPARFMPAACSTACLQPTYVCISLNPRKPGFIGGAVVRKRLSHPCKRKKMQAAHACIPGKWLPVGLGCLTSVTSAEAFLGVRFRVDWRLTIDTRGPEESTVDPHWGTAGLRAECALEARWRSPAVPPADRHKPIQDVAWWSRPLPSNHPTC